MNSLGRLYKKSENDRPLYIDVNNMARYHEQREKIILWFYMALLKKSFGGHSHTILSSMHTVLKDNIHEE